MTQKPTILVVDDDTINRDILRSTLEDEYDILEAEDGQQALEVLDQHAGKVEGILLDLVMPRMDGFGFLERYVHGAWRNVPVLVATGDERMQTEDRCLEAGAWDVIRKPYNPVAVKLRLKNTISRRRLSELETQQRMEDTFSKYMEPTVVKTLLRSGGSEQDLEGKIAEIAVLFVDIRGFTALSEQMETDKVVDILNRFLTLTSDAIRHNEGTLDKFIGDCTMAFWGAPVPCEDKAYLACRAAAEMMELAKEFTIETKRKYGQGVTFSVGIHMGPAVVGSFGGPDRKDYTAIGDTVNTASRLESVAQPGSIYISRAVAQALGSRARVTSLGQDIPLKGKRKGLEVLVLEELDGKVCGRGETAQEEPQAQVLPELRETEEEELQPVPEDRRTERREPRPVPEIWRTEQERCLGEADRMVDLLGGVVEYANGKNDQYVPLLRSVTRSLLEELARRGDHRALSPLDIQRVTMAAVVHDVGKIAMSNEILEKRGRLTPEEFSIMKDHTIIGANMVRELLPAEMEEPLVKAAYEICRWHHERYDGSGYPDKLQGDEIPISAQVVGLADVFSTMATDRPYQKAIPQEEVLRMMLKGECGSFDPRLLECLKTVVQQLLPAQAGKV